MPFSNVPEHLQEKMERCVQKVMAEGKEKKNAIAICHDSVVGKGPISLSMIISKTSKAQSDGRVRWWARANTGEVDLENDRFAPSFFNDIMDNFYLVSLAMSRGEESARKLPAPILDISHYSHTLPADKRNLARVGWPTKVWRDGQSNALLAQGYFDDTPQGQIAAKAVRLRQPEDRRVSICVYPDWERVDTDVETGIRTFNGGAGVAYLDHLALTANPIDPGAQIELEDTMAKSLQIKDDALQVLGEDAGDWIDELEEARKASKSQVDDGALIKADALKSEETMDEKTKTDATEATDEQKDETTEGEVTEEETTEQPATLSAAQIGPVVADELTKALPKIGEAINQRIQPLQEAIETLKSEIDVLKTSETEKLVAALKSDGNWIEGVYKEMFGNSVQRVDKSDAVKGETAAGPQEAFGEYAARYGNPKT